MGNTMYKALTKEHWVKHLGLSNDYKIDAMICYGSYNVEKYTTLFLSILDELNISYEKEVIPYPFLEPITSVLINGKRIWFTTNYGGSMLCEFLHLACLFGSQKNILIGSCGGLSNEVEAGDIIIPTYTYGDESSTRMYNRSGDKKQQSNASLSASLEQRLGDKYTIFHKQLITCSAMLGETWEDIQQWSKEGYYGVEMESSTVFAVSNHFNVPSAALIYMSDNLIKEQIVGDESHAKQKPVRESMQKKLLQVAIEEIA